MPLDALCLTALISELSQRISGAKLDRIQQPERDVLVLTLKPRQGENVKLLLCAGSGTARLQLTDTAFENPAAPPMFCMLLRKQLLGGRIISLTQPPRERIADICIRSSDALGDSREKHLVLELMNTANIILSDEDGVIIDCLRRAGSADSGKRPVLPGLRYRLPDAPGKIDVIDGSFDSALLNAGGGLTDKRLLDYFFGISPLIARELVYRAAGDGGIRAAVEELRGIYRGGEFSPTLILRDGRPLDFSFMRIEQYGSAAVTREAETFSELLGGFFDERTRAEHMRSRSSALMKTVRLLRDRTVRRLAAQKNELLAAEKKELLRECGDLITANIYRVRAGDTLVTAEDYYNGNILREIKLDPRKTPQQNAAKYYKDYKKAKNAELILSGQIESGERELVYFESVIDEIARAESEQALAEIRAELAAEGILKNKSDKKAGSRQGKKAKPQKPAAPLCFTSSAGLTIRVGRNNLQNERLALRDSAKTDVWLHAQKRHGSHVVISCAGGAPDERSVEEAAALAAFYSEARNEGKVPVDYCLIKYVKKQPGGRTGMVLYTDYRSLVAAPRGTL
jgi:predicted ribosome quality control (RQC) complex YloA/Tae2 family protein